MIFQHHNDCSKLIKCERVEYTDFFDETCQDGTLFNQDLQVYDWADNVVCKTST